MVAPKLRSFGSSRALSSSQRFGREKFQTVALLLAGAAALRSSGRAGARLAQPFAGLSYPQSDA